MGAIAVAKLVLTAGTVLTVFSIGLRARPADTLLLLRNPKLGVRAMVSMFVLVPLFVVGLALALQLGPTDRAALMALSISPMPPILPRRQAVVGGGGTTPSVCVSGRNSFRSSSRPWSSGWLDGCSPSPRFSTP